jgi:hypothetical protein
VRWDGATVCRIVPRMLAWQAYPSAISNGVNAADRTLVDPGETIGLPSDRPATDVDVENSMFALLKGIAAGLGVPAGSGDAAVNTNTKTFVDPITTLGETNDAAATGTDRQSAISLLKGITARGIA